MTEKSNSDLDLSLAELCQKLEQGETSSSELVAECLGRIDDPAGEGRRSFLSVATDRAMAEAEAVDQQRAEGHGHLGPFAGIPIAVKDLFDIAGETTTAGSTVLADRPPASADAPCVARLRQAGMIVLGRTNMTEFAYSGLGINPHFDTPRSIWKREDERIPGGSSSGSAVAVADRQAFVGLGTDTGGSCRIPAAFSNIVGYKPTSRLIPLEGVSPLAPSLDSVGPIADSVATCSAVHKLMTGEKASDVQTALYGPEAGPEAMSVDLPEVRLALLNTIALDGLDPVVEEQFERALNALRLAGVQIAERELPMLNDLGSVNRNGGLAAGEAYRWHRDLLRDGGAQYDPRVRTRIEAGVDVHDSDLSEILAFRQQLVSSFATTSKGFDAWVLPTVAILPPRISDFPPFSDGADDFYRNANITALRNTSIGNMLDSCAISLPLCESTDRAEAPPVGLMLMAPGLSDEKLLSLAAALEPVCRSVA